MKATMAFLLVAALVTLPFASASPANLEWRQAPAVIACTQGADCKAAAFYWNDCQTAETIGLSHAPHSAQRGCLCTSDHSSPSHPDWYSKLTSCIQCINNARGFHDEVLNPLQALHVNFCTTGELTYNDFLVRAHQITANSGFPLELPEAILVSTVARSFIAATPTSSEDCKASKPSKTSHHAAEATAPSPIHVAEGCNYDNCLRQVIQSEGVVIPFCKTYTSAVQTPTTGYPEFVSMCNNQPKSISSACTCIVAAQTPMQSLTSTQSLPSTRSQSPIQSNTSSNGGVATTEPSVEPSRHTHTSWVTTIIYITRTDGVQSSTVHGSSSTSCPTTSGTSTWPPISKSPSAAPFSSTSSSAAPATTSWVTLPASDGMKACAASEDCVTANSIYYQCLNAQVNGDQTGSWNCFCKSHFGGLYGWNSSVSGCTACVVKNLPPNPTGNLPSDFLIPAVAAAIKVVCNETYPDKSTMVSNLDYAGMILTNKFESPIDFFGMTLLDAPPPSAAPSSIVPRPTSTILSSVTVIPIPASTASASSNGIHTTSSTSSASAVTPTWITFPPTKAMLQCQANDCQPAARVYNGCILTKLNGTNQDPIFDCFCTANKALWQSTLSDCANCIAAALPASNPGSGDFQASGLKDQVEYARSYFCSQSEATMADHALQVLGAFGNSVTLSFQLPIEFFGMTLLPGPIVGRDVSTDGS